MFERCIFNEVFLTLSWDWLHDSETKVLTRDPDFSKKEQNEWFTEFNKRTDDKTWGFRHNRKPAGCFGIKNIKKDTGLYWGYIGKKTFRVSDWEII
jgi:hypothetical protein